MAYADTLYSARLGHEILIRGRDNVIKCPVYRDGALAAPASGTVTLYDSSGAEVVSAAAVTVTGSVAQRTVTTATLTPYDYGDRWRVEWSLVMPDGVTHLFVAEAALTRRAIYPVVTDADLIARVPALSPTATQRITRASNYQDRLDEAWRMLMDRLIRHGNTPWWLADPVSLREPHLLLTLSLIFRDLAVYTEADGGLYAQEAARYEAAYEQAYRDAQSRIHRDADTVPTVRRQSPSPTLWTCKGRAWPI